MDEKTVRNIELIWEYGGACPDQWYSYFYNEHSDKTYCVYIRQDSWSWSAALRNADGCHTDTEFEELPSEIVERENIELAFDYLSCSILPYDREEAYFRRVVEEVLIYLNHRFPYFHFYSQVRDDFDFIGEIDECDKDFSMEVLSRRAQLMRRYLAEYEKFLNSMSRQRSVSR